MMNVLDHATQKLSIHVNCPCCGKEQVVTVDADRYNAWRRGELMIQHALPDLTPDKREILISGICPDCWDRMFKEDPDA